MTITRLVDLRDWLAERRVDGCLALTRGGHEVARIWCDGLKNDGAYHWTLSRVAEGRRRDTEYSEWQLSELISIGGFGVAAVE